MVYETCKSLIETGFENNSFMTRELMVLQVEMFNVAGSITEEEYNELKLLLHPVVEEPVQEPQI